MIIIWAAERKTLQIATICQELIWIFPSYEILLSLSPWPSDSFPHKSTSVLWWTASPPAGTVSTGLMLSFTWSSHTRTNQRLSSEIRQLGTRGQLCHHVHFRYCFPSQPKWELSKQHKAIIQVQMQSSIFGSTDHFRTLQTHLGLTLIFMFSDSSLKYKACLVYQLLPLYWGQNIPNTLRG